mmetsp:Transcript_9491/g.9036  ORF Transcript_9491/g.9036 Transcript_9491/m.9036 type:complete len:90 (+) Transcript_9491:2384-2653(+)
MEEINNRGSKSPNGVVFATGKKQIDQLLAADLMQFGGFSESDITEYKLLEKNPNSKSKLSFLNGFKLSMQEKPSQIKDDFKMMDNFLEQ